MKKKVLTAAGLVAFALPLACSSTSTPNNVFPQDGVTPQGGAGPTSNSGGASGGSTPKSSGGAMMSGTAGASSSPGCAKTPQGMSGTNPLLPALYTADPAVLVHNCTFYITAGHDEGTTGFLLKEWYVLSSTDLVNWTDNGGPKMTLGTFAWADANAWAGQMVEKDGTFYWYVPINETGHGMAIGVAKSNSPLGPFVDARGTPLVNDTSEMAAFGFKDPGQTAYTIDPTVFRDDDGKAYLLYGGFWRLVTAELGSDMTSIVGPMTEVTPQGFFEAPYLIKRKGLYYLFYAADQNPATIDYSTSTSPRGPWTYRGRVLDALPNLDGEDAATSHPAAAEFGGNWYFVYHISNGPGGGTYRRQVAMEKLYFASDGSVEKVTPTTGIAF